MSLSLQHPLDRRRLRKRRHGENEIEQSEPWKQELNGEDLVSSSNDADRINSRSSEYTIHVNSFNPSSGLQLGVVTGAESSILDARATASSSHHPYSSHFDLSVLRPPELRNLGEDARIAVQQYQKILESHGCQGT